jgi:hypothetical protein
MICLVCRREVDKHACGFHTKTGYVCCRCEGAEYDVFRVQIPGCTTFIGNSVKDTIEFLTNEMTDGDCEDPITVTRGKMLALEYHNLREWDG